MKHITLWFLPIFCTMASCKEDSERFVSYPPRFSEIRITDLEGAPTTPKVGVPFVATAIQSEAGKLLYTTNYAWTLEGDQESLHRFKKQVVYGKANENPCDTITAMQSGNFTLQLTANYNVAGQTASRVLNGDLSDGSSISYTLSPLKIIATLRKEIEIN